MAETNDEKARHLRACEGFSRIAAQADGRWHHPSPCSDWGAGDVVEHVIGFHDVLLLRPLDAKPLRPKGDPAARWAVTVDAIAGTLKSLRPDPTREPKWTPDIDFDRLLPMLTIEMLVHTWDLAMAVGCGAALDSDLCEFAYQSAQINGERLRASGMFASAAPVADDVGIEFKLVALLGRDPSWTPNDH